MADKVYFIERIIHGDRETGIASVVERIGTTDDFYAAVKIAEMDRSAEAKRIVDENGEIVHVYSRW